MSNLSKFEFCKLDPTQTTCQEYNILVLEAATYMGLMTSEFINFMEQQAYYSARSYCNNDTNPNYFPHRDSERIAMPEIFDMISGSETGAIIASSLVLPNDDPETNKIQPNKYFAGEASKFFYKYSSELYVD